MPYEVKAITKTIKATSRASVKVGESYYTVEYSEERIIPDIEGIDEGIDIEKERQFLWEDINAECDNQIEDILKTFKK